MPEPSKERVVMDDYRAEPTPEMLREGARALDLWSDESLREEIDGQRMAGLVWKAMVAQQPQGGVEAGNALYAVLDAVASGKGEDYTHDQVAAVMDEWLKATLDRTRGR